MVYKKWCIRSRCVNLNSVSVVNRQNSVIAHTNFNIFKLSLPVTNRDHHATYLKRLKSPIAVILAMKTKMRFEGTL